jgi:hypothetical protein
MRSKKMKQDKNLILLIFMAAIVLVLGSLKLYEKINKITNINDFPKNNDSSVIVYGNLYTIADVNPTNLQSKIVNIGNVYFNFESIDNIVTITVNNNTIYTHRYEIDGDTEENDYGYPFILMTDKYIVINETWKGIGTDTLNIYKTDGTLVRTIEDTADILMLDDNYEEVDVQIKLYKNKLYFVSITDYETAKLNYYDFATDEIKEIDEFSAWTNQQA